MENASKALLIAAGVLIGGIILSLGVSLYMALSGYVESSHEDIRNKELNQFNNQYTKYIDVELTIHDVVTAANTAYESNHKYNLTEPDENNYYVTINLPGYDNLEKNINLKSSEILEKGLGKKYRCSSEDDVIFSQETGRVRQLDFHEDS